MGPACVLECAIVVLYAGTSVHAAAARAAHSSCDDHPSGTCGKECCCGPALIHVGAKLGRWHPSEDAQGSLARHRPEGILAGLAQPANSTGVGSAEAAMPFNHSRDGSAISRPPRCGLWLQLREGPGPDIIHMVFVTAVLMAVAAGFVAVFYCNWRAADSGEADEAVAAVPLPFPPKQQGSTARSECVPAVGLPQNAERCC